MPRMNGPLRIYVYGVILVGALALLVTLLAAPPGFSQHSVRLAAVLVGLTVLGYLVPVKLAPKRHLVLNTSLYTVAVLTLTPGEAAAVAVLAAIAGNTYLRRPWFNTLFNAAQLALSALAAGGVYRLAAGTDNELVRLAGIVAAGVLLFLISTFTVDFAAAIQRRTSPFANWWSVHATNLSTHVVLVAVGVAVTAMIEHSLWLVLVVLIPIAILRAVMQVSLRLDEDTVAIAESIADAVEARHPYLAGRARRMAQLAEHVSRSYGLAEDERSRICLAARLHDVHAALLPEHVVLGAGGDHDARLAYLRDHPVEGAAYVGGMLRLPGVAEIIRFHHERFDGRGYPRGISGNDIPIESRILAVCEAWVTLTTADGPRPALSDQQALVMLRAGAGTQWDPEVVERLAVVVADGAPDAMTARAGAPATGMRHGVA